MIKDLLIKCIPKSKFLFLNFWYRNVLKSDFKVDMSTYKKLKFINKLNVIDIGANKGLHSYFFSKNFNFVYAFEPLSDISKNIIYIKNAKLYNYALSNSSSVFEIYIPIINGVLDYQRASLSKNYNSEKRLIQTKRLDDFELNNIGLIKIDVEGHELDVLKGSMITINKYKPILYVEIELQHQKKQLGDLIDLLNNMNYKIFQILNNELIEFNQKNILLAKHNNFLCIHDQKLLCFKEHVNMC